MMVKKVNYRKIRQRVNLNKKVISIGSNKKTINQTRMNRVLLLDVMNIDPKEIRVEEMKLVFRIVKSKLTINKFFRTGEDQFFKFALGKIAR